MKKREINRLIGDLAICFYSKYIKVSYASLNSILKDSGCAFKTNKELKKGVKAAYRYWENKDRVIHHALAYLFNDLAEAK